MSSTVTALAAVHDVQQQLDQAFGPDPLASHHAHPFNATTASGLQLCNRLTASVSQLEAALNASSHTPALSKTLATLNDFANERYAANQQLRSVQQQQQQSSNSPIRSYILPRHQDLQSALSMIAASCGFELYKEDHMVTLGGKVSVVDFELDRSSTGTGTKRGCVNVHFSYGPDSKKNEQLDQMLLVLAQAECLNPLWRALADLKRLDDLAGAQPDVFERTQALVASLLALAYQLSPNPTFFVHAAAEDLLELDLEQTHQPGQLALQLFEAQTAQLRVGSGSDSAPFSLAIEPGLVFGRATGTLLMQALGKLDVPLPVAGPEGRPVFIEDLLQSSAAGAKVHRFEAQDRFKHTLPDCPPLVFSLGTPAVERGFWLSSLALDSPEQVHLVLPLLRQQARLNALVRSAFDSDRRVERQAATEEDALFDLPESAPESKVDLSSDPEELSVELHWTEQGCSLMFPLRLPPQHELDLHVLDLHLDGQVWLDGQPHAALQRVLQIGCSLPLALRWLHTRSKPSS